MAKQKFKVSCYYEEHFTAIIEAETQEEADEIAMNMMADDGTEEFKEVRHSHREYNVI